MTETTLFSWIAILGGLYFFGYGFRLLARERLLLATPNSKIRSAAIGLVEVNGIASGPNTMPAPITGKPCFLYHTTCWQQKDGKKNDWQKVVDETLHLPFFINDGTGQLFIEPLGADLDLHRDFHEEYSTSFFTSSNDVPLRVSVFLAAHGVVPEHAIRVEERAIKPGDDLFIAGTLAENPGVEARAVEVRMMERQHLTVPTSTPEQPVGVAPQVVRLHSGDAPSSTLAMSQQSKISAALNRAGITKPEAWAAAGVPYQPMAETSQTSGDNSNGNSAHAVSPENSSSFDVNPPVVLMKGENDSTFVISFRSQKEFVVALAWKSGAMIWGGAAAALLGLYVLLQQTLWLKPQ